MPAWIDLSSSPLTAQPPDHGAPGAFPTVQQHGAARPCVRYARARHAPRWHMQQDGAGSSAFQKQTWHHLCVIRNSHTSKHSMLLCCWHGPAILPTFNIGKPADGIMAPSMSGPTCTWKALQTQCPGRAGTCCQCRCLLTGRWLTHAAPVDVHTEDRLGWLLLQAAAQPLQ